MPKTDDVYDTITIQLLYPTVSDDDIDSVSALYEKIDLRNKLYTAARNVLNQTQLARMSISVLDD